MAEPARRAGLERECRTFCRYLCDQAPPAEVLSAYLRAHECGVVPDDASAVPLEAALLRLARTGPSFTRAADAYAVTFAKTSLLRQKLVLLLAILESCGSTNAAVDTAVRGSRAAWVARVAISVVVFASGLCLAAAAMVPLRIWCRVVAPRS